MKRTQVFEQLEMVCRHDPRHTLSMTNIMTAIAIGDPIYTKTIDITKNCNVIIDVGDGCRVSSNPMRLIGNPVNMDLEYSSYPYAFVLDILDQIHKRKIVKPGVITYPQTIGRDYLKWKGY